LQSEALIPQMLGMSWRIITRGARTDSSALRAGDDEELQLLIPERSKGLRIVCAEGTWSQCIDGHAQNLERNVVGRYRQN
jgi:hypothetical protein